MRHLTVAIGCLLVTAVVFGAAFLTLEMTCSSGNAFPKLTEQSQPNRADNKTQDTEASEQSGAPDKTATDQPSARFDLRVSEQNKIEGHYYAETGKGEKQDWSHQFVCDTKITDFLIALFTLCLIVIGAWQGWQLKQAVEATRELGEASTAMEYPIIGTSFMGPELETTDVLVGRNEPYGCQTVDTWPTRYSVISEIEFRNYGRTPAFLKHIQVGTAVSLLLPEKPHYRQIVYCDPGTVIQERETKEIDLTFGFELSDEQIKAITETTAILWLYIALTYTDVRGRQHEVRSCWKWGRQNPAADEIRYFFDDGSAPAAYTAKT